MEYILIICISLITLAVLKFVWGIRIKDIKLLKELGFDKKLNEITNKLPENREICNDILKILGNENVNVKENEGNQASLYIAISNSIIIANIKNTFTRVQTIAHECLHSVQNRRTLIFNFILSNLYIIYFISIIILTIFKLNPCKIYIGFGFIILGFIQYTIRSYLEMDAMIKAPVLAEKYIQQKNTLINEEQKAIFDNYKIINTIGIKLSNYSLIANQFIKLIIYLIACMIF